MTRQIEFIDSIRAPEYQQGAELSRAAGRRKHDAYLIEGEDMIRAALHSPSRPTMVFAVAEEAGEHPLLEELLRRGIPTYGMKQGMLFKMLGTSYKTSTWCVAVVPKHHLPLTRIVESGAYLQVIGERVQDPRNVGVMIRTAEAVGAGAFLLTEDSADAYSRAAVRSTTGSILRLPVEVISDLEYVTGELKEQGYTVCGTSVRAPAGIYETALPRMTAFIFGNESEGMSQTARGLCDLLVSIPMRGGAHSLNITVAMGICVFEWRRQLALKE